MTVWPYLTADRKYPPHLSLGCLKGWAHITLRLTSLFHKNLCIDLSWLLCIVNIDDWALLPFLYVMCGFTFCVQSLEFASLFVR